MMAAGCDSMALRLAMGHAGPEMQAHYAAKSARWRTLLAGWKGGLRLRDPAEADRLRQPIASRDNVHTVAHTA